MTEIWELNIQITSYEAYIHHSLTHQLVVLFNLARAFNLLTRTFNLPTRALNLETCAFGLLDHEFEL